LLSFAPKPSSGLSQASIFGASVGGLILNLQNKHPFTYKLKRNAPITNRSSNYTTADANVITAAGTETISSVPTVDDTLESSETCQYYTRPLIDYDMAMFLAPMEMAGAVLGVLVQTILPNWLYLMVASLILGFTAYKTYDKWWDIRTKEKVAVEVQTLAAAASDESSNSLENAHTPFLTKIDTTTPQHDPEVAMLELHHDQLQHHKSLAISRGVSAEPTLHSGTNSDDEQPNNPDTNASNVVENDDVHYLGDLDAEKVARRNFLLERDARQYPAEKLLVFCLLWAGLTLLTFFKGGKGVDSIIGITCEDAWYGILIAVQFLWTLGFAAFFGWKLIQETHEKKAVGYPFHPQDVLWDFQKTRFYAFFTFIAGVVAGLVRTLPDS
jgi:hypothetical protein